MREEIIEALRTALTEAQETGRIFADDLDALLIQLDVPPAEIQQLHTALEEHRIRVVPQSDAGKEQLRAELDACAHLMTERELALLKLRYGLDAPSHTIAEAAAHFHVIPDRIRQQEAKACRALRAWRRRQEAEEQEEIV